MPDLGVRVVETGRAVGGGSFICVECGASVALAALDAVPECSCGGSRFRRASLFEQPTTDDLTAAVETEPGWLSRTREVLNEQGHEDQFIAFESEHGAQVLPLPRDGPGSAAAPRRRFASTTPPSPAATRCWSGRPRAS